MNTKNPPEFKKLKSIAEPFKKRLYFVGILTRYLKGEAVKPVVVGGNAVEFYTFGGYATGDIDIVYPETEAAGSLLRGWGFKKEGRHWFSEDLDIMIEIPSSMLEPAEKKNVVKILVEGLDVYIIGIEDLIVDRLNSFVWWKYARDGEWAAELMEIHDKKIDWKYLRKRSREEGTLHALARLRKKKK